MTYRPIFRRQIGDPTTIYDRYECTFSSGAMALDFHTLGKIQLWGGQLLAKSGLSSGQITDGTSLYDLKRAWARVGYYLSIRTGATFYDLERYLRAGHGAVVQIDHDQLDYGERCSSFLGNHAVYINPEQWDDGAWLMGNPLCSSFRWVDRTHLRAAAEKLGRSQGLRPDPGESLQPIFFATTTAHIELPDTSTAPDGGLNRDTMITETVTSHHLHLAKGVHLRKYPSSRAPIVKTLANPMDLVYRGRTDNGWRVVRINTGIPYQDKQARPTDLYVPGTAGVLL